MANTDRLRYSLEGYDKLPDWLKRSWNVYIRVSIRADYKLDLQGTREALEADPARLHAEVIRIQRDYRFGQGMDALIRELLTNPDVTEDEQLNKIAPSIRFINYGLGEVQPSDDPKEEFARNERLNQLFIQSKGLDLTRTSELTYLVIPTGTTKGELRSFIDEYYEDALHLMRAGELYFESDKNNKQRITRVTEDSILDERIHELRASGLFPKKIAPLINQEFDKDLEPFEVSKRLNQMKKRKDRQ